MTIVPDMAVYAWIARYVSLMLTRYHIRGSGRTAHEEATDTTYRSEMGFFGEKMRMKESTTETGMRAGGPRLRKADTPWKAGVWVGRSEVTNEHLLLTSTGPRATLHRVANSRKWKMG